MSDAAQDTTQDQTQEPTQDQTPESAPFSLDGANAVRAREGEGIIIDILDVDGTQLFTLDENGQRVKAQARILGQFSDAYRNAERVISDRMLQRRATDITAEQVDENEAEKLAACVPWWNLRNGTKSMPASVHNVKQVFRAAPWIRRRFAQVNADPTRFLAR